MDDDGATASIILFLFLVLIDMFFYGVEAAIHSLNVKDVEKGVEEKDKKAMKLMRFLEKPERYVNSMQLIVSLINVIVGAVVLQIWCENILKMLSPLFAGNPSELIKAAVVVFTVFVLVYILLTFGVLLPKELAGISPKKWAYAGINPAYFVVKLVSPLTGFVTVTVKGIVHLLGRGNKAPEADVEETIINMVNEGHEHGLIQASEAEMISNIFEMGDKEARDIMTNRTNITAIDGATPLKDAITYMVNGKNSRYPVYEENIDHIIGILHFKDAMRLHVDENSKNVPICELDGLLREAHFVPQTKKIDELFKEMQSNKWQMVIVIDEYGQTDGLVAMEDILEEIVGNIQDEYDEDGEYIEEKGEDEYVIEGKTPLEELEERFGITFETEDYETLNGFLISQLDRIPEPDEQYDVDYAGYHFQILSVENKMIQSVLVSKLPESDSGEKENMPESALEETVK